MVTIRQGTLQVIHLTVKEFLTAKHGPKSSTYTDLLIDPAKASLHLTLACLECIKANCNKSIVRLDPGTARLDIELDVEAVIQRRFQAPLVEYASLTWMMHLTECDGAQMISLAKAFEKTFNSPSTFYWVEACMAFQPDSVLHLLAGLEEVVDHVSSLGLDLWPESEASCVFFTGWCYALRNVFEEHGLILSHRPWEVYFLDLQSSFSQIGQLYKQFGDTSRRDTTLRIAGYKSPRLCPPRAEAHTQLQQDMQGPSYEKSFFFVHDERRGLYLWGETFIDLSNVRLFVQNATTGQRLPPAVNFHGEKGRQGLVSSYGLSPSGDYVVVVYSTMAKNSSSRDGLYLTMIWQISDELTFKRRMRSEPWAKIIFIHQYKTSLFLDTNMLVVFTDSGHCLTPSGEIHLASGSRRPLLDRLSNRSVPDESTILGSFYSQNGKYLFMSEMTASGVNSMYRATRLALFTETAGLLCSWGESSRSLDGVSPSGRYLVLSSDRRQTVRGDEFLYLYDVDTNGIIRLPFVERMNYGVAKYQFAKDELELIAFIPGVFVDPFMMTVLVWSDLQSDPSLKSYGRFKAEYITWPSQIHVNKNDSSALMVSENRLVQRVEFRTQVRFPDTPDLDDDCPHTVSQISKDGDLWAQLRYGQNKAQLHMTGVSYPKGPVRKLDLELSHYDEPQIRTAAFSPDLSLLVIDAQVFSITKGVDSLTTASLTIQGLPELLVRYRTNINPRYPDLLRCLISPCKTCIIFIDRFARGRALATFYAFRIDVLLRSSVRLDLHLPKDLTYISANFHPSSHLMLLSYSSFSRYDDVQVLEEVSNLHIFIVELEDLEMKPLSLPKGDLFLKRLKWFELCICLIRGF